MPYQLANDLTTRTLAQAGHDGLTELESLGQPYALSRGIKVLGVLVSGRGTDARPEGHEKTCFVALVEPGRVSVSVLPTVGRGRWATNGCHGYTALGLLPSGPGQVRLGIIYDTDKQPLTSPVVLAWLDGQQPAIDEAGTTACALRHATTIDEMRRSDCGKLSAVERAFR